MERRRDTCWAQGAYDVVFSVDVSATSMCPTLTPSSYFDLRRVQFSSLNN